jgi:riboflavin synthase
MFTGLVKDQGRVCLVSENLEGKIFEFETRLAPEINVDDSVAVNGVCLTAIKVTKSSFTAQAVHVTLEKTNLGFLMLDSIVNLELALKYSDRLGGHLVLGHVNGVAEVLTMENRGENSNIWYRIPDELKKFVIKEGSIALDGISLTVADIKDNLVMVTIIPHTWNETQIRFLKPGTLVNVEVDSQAVHMAKYLDVLFENYLKQRKV